MSRRWRYPRGRRGTFQRVVPQPVVASAPTVPPRFSDQAGWRPRWPQMRARGGRFFEPVWAPPVTSAPAYVPQWIRPPELRPVLRVRRGFQGVPPGAPPPIAPYARGRMRPPGGPRRGEFFPTGQGQAPPPHGRRRPRPILPSRRGEFFPPAALQPLAPASWTRRRPLLPSRRGGKFLWAPPAPLVVSAPPWIPSFLARADARVLPSRRPRRIAGPLPVVVPVPARARARRVLLPVRRGRLTWPVGVGVALPVLRALRVEVHGPATSGPQPTGLALARVVDGVAVRRTATGAATAPLPVDGPAVLATPTPDGPAVRRTVAGPDTSRTITGTGV